MLYADDVILIIREPEIFLPEIIKCVEQFGSVSGYKVNFHKSEIMPIGSHSKHKPLYIDPFSWAHTWAYVSHLSFHYYIH